MRGASGLATSIGRSIPPNHWLVILTLVSLAALTLHMERRKKAGEALQAAVTQLPSGISAAEAAERLGAADETQLVSGVLRYNTLWAAENAKANGYGPSRLYEVRLWRRGAVRAAVYVDANQRVAGRTVWNRRQELRGGFFDSLGLAD